MARAAGGRDVVRWDFAAAWNRTLRWWSGLLLEEIDRPDDASPYFESLWRTHYWEDPQAAFELARIRERSGDTRGAIEAYDFAATAWSEADPELAPKAQAARTSLMRLVGAGD